MENFNKILPHQIPDRYFEQLSDNIMAGIKASLSDTDVEIDFLSDAAAIEDSRSAGDSDYFVHFSDRIMSEIQSLEGSVGFLRQSEGIQPVFEVPDGYFKSLPDRIHQFINDSDEDLAESGEILPEINRANPYTVPARYFETFSVKSPEVTKSISASSQQDSQDQPKSSLKIRFFRSMRWNNVIAASVVFLILGWGAFIMLENDRTGMSSDMTRSALYSQATLGKSQSEQLAYAELLQVSDEALLEYIETEMESDDIYILMNQYAKSNKLHFENFTSGILDGISDEDIQSYLEYEGYL